VAERPTPSRDDEFYVGYLPQAPAGIAAVVRVASLLLLALAAVLAVVLIVGQGPFADSRFEFGVERDFEGVVTALPHPALWAARPGRAAEGQHFSRFALVAAGKHGAEDELAGMNGRPVRLRGSLIYRDGHTMIEIVAGSVRPLDGPAAAGLMANAPPEDEDLGVLTLEGEIVDSKCFYGVMKPGNLKPHRACATRCISGGVPPVLLVRTPGGRPRYFLLVSEDGETVNRRVLDLVAEPVSITGRVVRRGDLLLLMADPATYRRL